MSRKHSRFLAPAASGVSDGFTFRQLDTFWYLTGLEVPDAVLALDADRGSATLYAPVRDARFENPARTNDFPGRPLQTDPALGRRSGVVETKPIDQLERDLTGWIEAGRVLRLDPGGPGSVARLLPKPFQRSILITPQGRDNLTGHVARTPDGLEALMRRRSRTGERR